MLWFICTCIAAVCFYLYNCIESTLKPLNYPPGPAWLPWLGSALIVNKLKKKYDGDIHAAFQELANEYNTDILGLKLGNEKVVVVFNEMSLKILQNQAFDGRPDSFFSRLRTMGYRKGITSVDGPFWEEHRQFTTKNLRGNGYGKKTMDDYIIEELSDILEEISKKNNNVNILTLLSTNLLSILWLFLSGKIIDRKNDRIKYMVCNMQKRNNAFDLAGGILNQMPWLRFIAPNRTGYTIIKELNTELYTLFSDMIFEHPLESDDKDNLINSYITEINKGGENSTFTYEQLMMVCVDFFFAGSTTVSEYLNLAFLAMLHNPEVQRKVQSELEAIIGQRQLTINDRNNTPYTMAVIHEIFRRYTLLNIIGPRRPLKDVNLGEYVIPSNVTVLVSMKSLYYNDAYWNDPAVFRPERFLNEENKLINTEKIRPFGMGKRKCIGDILARNCIYLFFGGILQRYRIEPANGKMPTDKLQHGIFTTAPPYSVNFITT